MKHWLVILCVGCALASPATAQSTQTRNDIPSIVAAAHSAVVLLKTFGSDGRLQGLGSGFRVVGGRFVTNAHVVAGAARIEVFDDNGNLLGVAHYADMLSTTVDLALLPALGASGRTLALAQKSPTVGEQVIVIGAPEGLSNTVSSGIVSANRRFEDRQLLQISAPISPGSSGGPVLNAQGEVVGVSVSILREGQNLNFAVPVADLSALVASRPGQFAFPSASYETQGAATTRSRNRGNWLATVPPLNLGSVSAVLTERDETLSSGGYITAYRFVGRRGTSVSISVSSTDFDPFVGVYRFEGDSARDVAHDDDSGGGYDAKTSFTFPEDGTYFVGVSSVSGRARKTGTYVITVAEIRNAEVVPPSRAAPSRWLPAGSTDRFTNEFDRTRITPMGNGVYRVWQRSTYASPYTDSGGDTLDTDLRQTDFDCNSSRYRTISQIQYLNGVVVWSSSDPGQWKILAPESVGEEAGAAICSYIRTHGR